MSHFEVPTDHVLFDAGAGFVSIFRPTLGSTRQFSDGPVASGASSWFVGAMSCVQFFGAYLNEAEVRKRF